MKTEEWSGEWVFVAVVPPPRALPESGANDLPTGAGRELINQSFEDPVILSVGSLISGWNRDDRVALEAIRNGAAETGTKLAETWTDPVSS